MRWSSALSAFSESTRAWPTRPASCSRLAVSWRHLGGGIVGGGGDLVGQARQALMQRLDRFLDAVMGGRLRSSRSSRSFSAITLLAQLVEGLGLFAGGDVDLLARCATSRGCFRDWLRSAGIQAAADRPRSWSSMRRQASFDSVSLRPTRASISSVSRRLAAEGGRPQLSRGAPDGRAAVKGMAPASSSMPEKLRKMRRVSHSPTDRPSRRAAARAASRASGGMPATFQGSSARISNSLAPRTRYRKYRGQDIV